MNSGSHDHGMRTGALGLREEPELNDRTCHQSMGMSAVLCTQAKNRQLYHKRTFSRANACVHMCFSYPVAQAEVEPGYRFGSGNRHVLHWCRVAGCYWFLGSGAYRKWQCLHLS